MHFRKIFEFLRVNPWHVKSLRAEFHEAPLLPLEPVVDFEVLLLSGVSSAGAELWGRAAAAGDGLGLL